MTLAILCSGQGPQHRGMFALTGDAPEAEGVFAHATRLLGGDPRELVVSQSDAALHRNRVAQLLCTLHSLAATAALRESMPASLVIAGYSVGEVAAWGAAGSMAHADVLDIVSLRAEIMDEASPAGDGLLFVRGLSFRVVETLCEQNDASVAIVNPGDAFVVGGSRLALQAFGQRALAMSATKVIPLHVEVASHTKRLSRASPLFRQALGTRRVSLPAVGTRLLSGIDGATVIQIEPGLDKLAAQISQTVRWADCLQACIEAGASAFLELGPGRALCEMAAGAYPDVPARSLEDFRTLEGARAWIASHAPRGGYPDPPGAP